MGHGSSSLGLLTSLLFTAICNVTFNPLGFPLQKGLMMKKPNRKWQSNKKQNDWEWSGAGGGGWKQSQMKQPAKKETRQNHWTPLTGKLCSNCLQHNQQLSWMSAGNLNPGDVFAYLYWLMFSVNQLKFLPTGPSQVSFRSRRSGDSHDQKV